MTTKEKLLELLEANRGIYFSGENIAQKLSISRTSVWKAVKLLRNEGYSIDAVTNKGYSLSNKTDILSAQGIQKYLRSEIESWNIAVLPTVTSTNALVREKANAGEAEGYVILSDEQKVGRGRKGRNFFSPKGTGIYMSILLRPELYSPEQSVRITTMAAVAMCEAIEAVSGVEAKIKWVNDIFVHGKKVCGILTEGSFDMESGLMEYAVLGVGVNLYEPANGFPDELKEIAGTVLKERRNDVKNRLASEFLNRFYSYYSDYEDTEYVSKYRNRSFVIGKRISVLSANSSRTALALDVDDECHLQVKYEDGKEENLSSGEISIQI